MAATEVLARQIEGKGKFRAQPNALLLTAGLVWFINGIHSRPLEGPSCRELVRAILPHTDNPPNHFLGEQHVSADSDSDSDSDSTDEETGPWAPSGVLFFRDFLLPPDCAVPRMRSGRSISSRAIIFFFGKDYKTIQHLLDPVGILGKDDIPDSRIPTRKGLTHYWCGDDEPACFNLAANGYELPPPEIDVGDDMDVEAAEALNDNADETLDRKLTTIWHQFLIDIIQKAPNPKGQMKGSYCRTKEEDRCTVTDVFYQNRVLSDVWRMCQYKMAPADLWRNTFTRLWPPRGHILAPSAQNYSTCRYYLDWKRFMSDAPADVGTAARSAIKEKFDSLYWIPAATCDKIWNTTKAARGFTTLPDMYKGAAPQLLIKGGQRPIWNMDA